MMSINFEVEKVQKMLSSTKSCTRCLTIKPKSQFYGYAQGVYLHSWCRSCEIGYQREKNGYKGGVNRRISKGLKDEKFDPIRESFLTDYSNGLAVSDLCKKYPSIKNSDIYNWKRTGILPPVKTQEIVLLEVI
jgi:hypothetical protein